MTPDQQEIVDKLVDAARSVMHHDADDEAESWQHERRTLAAKFAQILFNSPRTRLLRRLAARHARRTARDHT
jgi:hypothetical protein